MNIDYKDELKNCSTIKAMLSLLIVIYHCLCPWLTNGWNINAKQESITIAYLAKWMNSFHVYAFTLVSGYIFHYAMSSGGGISITVV